MEAGFPKGAPGGANLKDGALAVNPKARKALETYVENTILSRVAKGQGLDGKSFPPYKAKDRQGQPVDLNESGRLMKSFKATYKGKVLSFTFTAPYGKYVNDLRPFLGLTKQEQGPFDDIIDEAIDEYIKMLAGGLT